MTKPGDDVLEQAVVALGVVQRSLREHHPGWACQVESLRRRMADEADAAGTGGDVTAVIPVDER